MTRAHSPERVRIALATLLLVLIAGPLPVAVADETRALITSALAGDAGSLAALVERLLPVIRARCLVFLSARPDRRLGPHDADDLMQEVWMLLVKDRGRQLHEYDPARGMSLEGYVGMLTQRELWGRLRAHRAQRRGGGLALVPLGDEDAKSAGAGDPESEAVHKDLLARLDAHLTGALPERGRVILRLLYTDGGEPQEVADALGVNLQVVYNWQHRIRTEARAWLASHEHGASRA